MSSSISDYVYLRVSLSAQKQKWPVRFHAKRGTIVDDIIFFLTEIDDPEATDLFLDIIDHYIIIKDYSDYVFSIASKIYSLFGKKDTIVIAPVRDEDGLTIKSGDSICYEIKSQLDPRSFKGIDTMTAYPTDTGYLKGKKILAVDDFIGTGSQFRKFSRKLQNEYAVARDDIYVFCIAAMYHRRERLQSMCHSFHAEILLEKILAAAANGRPDTKVNSLYDAVEALVSLKGPFYRRGYGKTEAAISLKRTPNNTLPPFWETKRRGGGQEWPAPFPRY